MLDASELFRGDLHPQSVGASRVSASSVQHALVEVSKDSQVPLSARG